MKVNAMSAKAAFATSALMSALATGAYANDSTGHVGVGGVQYLKNDKIAMHSEELYVSKDVIKVDYQFKNLSDKDITETVLFPLPAVQANTYHEDVPNPLGLTDSFKIWVNGKPITPTANVRVFMKPVGEDKSVDVTAEFKACGVSDDELKYPWLQSSHTGFVPIAKKLRDCKNAKIAKMIDKTKVLSTEDALYEQIFWDTQIIYGWQQIFKAGATTNIKHSYKPLIGGGVHFSEAEYQDYCVGNSVKKAIANSKFAQNKDSVLPYSSLSYILTTGANWAKPIADFKLTVERDNDEVVSFCWAGKASVVNQGNGVFTITEKNFTPSKDLNVVFIKVR